MTANIVEYVVMKGKTEVSRRTITIADGAIVAAHDGVIEGTNADVTFTFTPVLAEAMQAGTLNLSVGFMRGEVKVSGDNGVLFAVLAVLSHTNGW